MYKFICIILIFTLHTATKATTATATATTATATAQTACERSFISAILQKIVIPQTKVEQAFKALNYPKAFYSGLDEINFLTSLGQYLRHHLIDPEKTHIENLVPFIDRHIRHIQTGIEQTNQRERLPVLNILKQEASQRKKDKKVTLHWWQAFNLKLSLAAAFLRKSHQKTSRFLSIYASYRDILFITNGGFDNFNSLPVLESFPKMLVFPTISQLGILALNKVAKNGLKIIPVELVNQKKSIDGTIMDPLEAYMHDFAHIITLDYGIPLFSKNPKLHDQIISEIEALPPEKRKKAEVIYFILTHETPVEERPTIHQASNSEDLLQVINSSNSLENTLFIFAETQLLNSHHNSHLNSHHNREDLYRSENPSEEAETNILKESVDVFTQTVRKALKIN